MKEIKNVQEFREVIGQEKPVLLDFYADWCGPCQAMLPVVESLAEKYEDQIEVRKINVDKNGELAQKFNVTSIPTLFFIHDGDITEQIRGFKTAPVLEARIQANLPVVK